MTLRWRHNGRDSVSNHQPHHCLLNRYSDADQRKHQSSASLAFVWGIPRTNGQLRGKCFHLMTSSWILNVHVAGPLEQMDLSLNQRPVRGNMTEKRLIIPRVKHTDFGNSFTPLTVAQWNCLQDSISSADSVSSFRSSLTHWGRDKWTSFRRRHFQMHFLEWKCLNSD